MNGLHCAFTGRIGSDPEKRYTRAGKVMLTFSVAVDENVVATEDRPAREITWVRCTVWDDHAEALEETLTKGRLVYVEGRLRQNTWTAADGTERHGLNVSAWLVQPMGAIGRQAPRRQPVEAAG